MSGQLYACTAELADDLNQTALTFDPLALRYLRSASRIIERRAGQFLPVTAAKRLDGPGGRRLFLPEPLLALTAISNDGTVLTTNDWLLYPLTRHWDNGPYTRIDIDPDAPTVSAWCTERDGVLATGRWGKYEETQLLGTTTAEALTDSGTTLTVDNGLDVSPGMVLLIDSEQLLVDRVVDPTAGQWGVERAVNGTTAAAHDSGSAIYRYLPPWDVNWLCRQVAGLMRLKAQTQFAGRAGNPELGETFYISEFPKDPIKQVVENYRIVRI